MLIAARGCPFIDFGLRLSLPVEPTGKSAAFCFKRSKVSMFAFKLTVGAFGVEGFLVDGPASASDISIDSPRFAMTL